MEERCFIIIARFTNTNANAGMITTQQSKLGLGKGVGGNKGVRAGVRAGLSGIQSDVSMVTTREGERREHWV